MGLRGEEILSMGLDIGTTTTTLVVSRLTIRNTAGVFTVPRVEIVDKAIIYKSAIHFTPVTPAGRLDTAELKGLIRDEYRQAGVTPEEVKSGAVIITGEAATRENAAAVLSSLSRLAGDFVVSTAGPDLEAVIAGRGSGAAARSRTGDGLVANVDMGGGTTNIALFKGGNAIATANARVGGRLLEVEPGTTRVRRIALPAEQVFSSLGMRVRVGDLLEPADIQRYTGALVEVVGEILLAGGALSSLAKILLLGEPLAGPYAIDTLFFSGGVAAGIYGEEDSDITLLTRYGDTGLLLGRSVRESKIFSRYRVEKPLETNYATVIGAGMQLTELSGSTIHISDPAVLPLRDLPVVRPFRGEIPPSPQEAEKEIQQAAAMYRTEDGTWQPVALALTMGDNPSFSSIRRLAAVLAAGLVEYRAAGLPLVLVVDRDAAKVLGFTVGNMIGREVPVIAVDQVRLENGDYIDIGRPLYDGTVVPIVVKTLVFPS